VSRDGAIRAALQSAGLCDDVKSSHSLTGGCIHEVRHLTLADGSEVVAKINDARSLGIFQEEAAGLEALAKTNTVLTPTPLGASSHDGKAVLLMTALRPASANEETWRTFGKELVALHATDVGSRYGFGTDNHLGSTPQPNAWCDDWIEFNTEHRLGHQLRLLKGVLSGDENQVIRSVIGNLDKYIPAKPKPSLLHGDLWSGNALAALDDRGQTRIGVIDPACYIGDGWADIALMRLFGGFPKPCLDAYASAVDDHDRIESRVAVYQLYHVLNHITIFGRGYVSQAMSLARGLL